MIKSLLPHSLLLLGIPLRHASQRSLLIALQNLLELCLQSSQKGGMIMLDSVSINSGAVHAGDLEDRVMEFVVYGRFHSRKKNHG